MLVLYGLLSHNWTLHLATDERSRARSHSVGSTFLKGVIMMSADVKTKAENALLLLWYLSKLNPEGKTQFQKVMFFSEFDLVREGFTVPSFEYFRYNHGPYSKQLDQYLDDFRAAGIAVNQKKNANLTKEGEALADRLIGEIPASETNRKVLSTISRRINELRGKSWKELEELAYSTKLKPLNSRPNERERPIKEISSHRDLLDPKAQNAGGPGLEVSDDTLEKVIYALKLTPERRERMSREGDVSELDIAVGT